MTSTSHKVPGGNSALRPPERTPLAPPPVRNIEPLPSQTTGGSNGEIASEVPPPPPARARQAREQLNTKIRVDLRGRLDAFVRDHGSSVQGVLEAALDEYMSRRGWSQEDYERRRGR